MNYSSQVSPKSDKPIDVKRKLKIEKLKSKMKKEELKKQDPFIQLF